MVGAKLICWLLAPPAESAEPILIGRLAWTGRIDKLPEDLKSTGKVPPVIGVENATESAINQISLVDEVEAPAPIYELTVLNTLFMPAVEPVPPFAMI